MLGASLLGAGILVAAAQSPEPAAPWRPAIPLGLDLYLPVPEDNPLTPEKVALGRRLFFDPILSRDYTLSCASCHDPRRAFTDDLAVAIGVSGRRGPRNTPTLVNRGYGSVQFLDGRAASLEDQALQPIVNPKELDIAWEEVVLRLKNHSDYSALFQAAFGPEVNAENLARALASYVRTILSGDAPIDRYMDGEREALSELAREGLRLFRGKGNCTACHLGPTFSDEQFHNTGIAWRDGPEGSGLDPGRFAVTGKEEDRGAFKTPTLREIARTGPYMHDGSLASLEEVIEFYDRGGNPNPYFDPELRPLRLRREEKQALLAFLRALSGTIQEGLPRAFRTSSLDAL
ncbi:MAG: cytochrome-c peroxidase [Terriglobia bacterium]